MSVIWSHWEDKDCRHDHVRRGDALGGCGSGEIQRAHFHSPGCFARRRHLYVTAWRNLARETLTITAADFEVKDLFRSIVKETFVAVDISVAQIIEDHEFSFRGLRDFG